MHVNMGLQLLLVILSCGGVGVAITAMLLPHWITYYHHSQFWERTNVLPMGIFNEGRFGEAIRDEHGNRPVDLKHISEGRWTSYTMQCIRTSAIASAACGSLAAFLSIWQGLRFGSDKSIPCACLGLRCVLLVAASGGLSLTTGLLVYIVWPLLKHKKRSLDAGLEADEEMHLGVCVYLATGAICSYLLAFVVDLLTICCEKHGRRRSYRSHRSKRWLRQKSDSSDRRRHVSKSSGKHYMSSKLNSRKYRRKRSLSTTSSSQSLQLSSKSSSKPSSRVVHVATVNSAPRRENYISVQPQLYFHQKHQLHQVSATSPSQCYGQKSSEYHQQHVYYPQTDTPRRKAPPPPPPPGASQGRRNRQRARSESARDLRRAALSSDPQLHPHSNSLRPRRLALQLPAASSRDHDNYKRSRSKDTLVSYSNSSLESSLSSRDTLL